MQIIHKKQKDYTLAKVTSDMSLLLNLVCFIFMFILCIGIFAQIIGIIPKLEISQKDLCFVFGILILNTFIFVEYIFKI